MSTEAQTKRDTSEAKSLQAIHVIDALKVRMLCTGLGLCACCLVRVGRVALFATSVAAHVCVCVCACVRVRVAVPPWV